MSSPEKRDWMEDRLRSEKPLREAPPGFVERVMGHLPDTASRPVLKQSELAGTLWPRLAFVTATIAMAAVIVTKLSETSPEMAQVDSASESGIESIKIPIPQITAEQVQALTVKLDEPLDTELKNMISDTRQAIQFVASNFLPEK